MIFILAIPIILMTHISERELELPDSVIAKLIKIVAEDKKIISLGAGEPDFPAAKEIVNYTKKIADKCNHYSPPGGRSDLKDAIIKKLRRENKIHTSSENVVVTAGSQEALLLAIGTAVDVTEQVIVPSPSFLAYVPTIELFDAVPIAVPLLSENNFEINPDDVEKQVDKKKTKALIINTPANPTGNVIKRKTLEELADIAVDYDLYIFSDEAYEKIIYDNAKHVSIASLNGMEDYVVSFFTFSKSHAMCGYRLGYCVAPRKVADAITKIHVYTSISAPTISQMLGVKALKTGDRYTNQMLKEYKRRRNFIVKRLNEIGLGTAMPQGAFYAFSNISAYSRDSRRFAMQLLSKAHVAVVPGVEFGRYGECYIRCSYATKLPLIEKAMDRMEKFLKRYR